MTRYRINIVPPWLTKLVIGTIVTALITGAAAWGTHLSARDNDHEKRISVVEDHQKNIDQTLQELKAGQAEQRQDTKEILKRLPRR